MLLAWSMTGFTSNPRPQSIELQLQTIHGAGRVTTKTLLRLVTNNRTAQCVFKRNRHGCEATDREIECAEFLKIANASFVKNIVATKDVSLTDVALTEAIKDLARDGVRAVGDCVRDVLALARDFVSVIPVPERQSIVSSNDLAIRRDFERLGHRRVHLRGFALVTVDAGFVADELDATRVCIRPPLGEKRVRLRAAEDHD